MSATPNPVKILSWNVNGRIRSAARHQIDAVLSRAPDIVALQEITMGSYPVWSEGLMEAGHSVVSAVDLVRAPYPESIRQIRRKYFNLTAARHPVAALPGLFFDDPEQAAVAFPEKYVAAGVLLGGAQVEIHNAHLPPGSTRGIIKVHAFQAIRRRVDESPRRP